MSKLLAPSCPFCQSAEFGKIAKEIIDKKLGEKLLKKWKVKEEVSCAECSDRNPHTHIRPEPSLREKAVNEVVKTGYARGAAEIIVDILADFFIENLPSEQTLRESCVQELKRKWAK